jgi:hypothetical protein
VLAHREAGDSDLVRPPEMLFTEVLRPSAEDIPERVPACSPARSNRWTMARLSDALGSVPRSPSEPVSATRLRSE